ncbi:hypothetical protein R3P38DRAFT_3071979 [Favolaschia claudopus]|uniref:JmjC domain-containing protein n=1 Tax=Favolaschia claudopus TaxID=2862362 RepID=A0AAV9ZY86_9AGAR
MPVSRPLELYEMPFLVAPQSAAPFSSSAETGPIVRALSHVPRAQAFPKLENMTLVADLPAQEAKSIFYRRAGEQQELESNPSSSLSNSVPAANSNVETVGSQQQATETSSEMQVEESNTEPEPQLNPPRRSTREKKSVQAIPIVGGSGNSKAPKRKATQPVSPQQRKKKKDTDSGDEEPETEEASDDKIEGAGPPRYQTPITIFPKLPDGSPGRSFDYYTYPSSHNTEYKLIYDVQKSSEALKDSSLKSLTFSEWSGMSESQRMAIWATGCDIYIHDLHAGAPVRNLNQLRGALTRWNCMDIPVEVQVQGLRTFPENNSEAEIDYTASIRTTTLDDMLEHSTRKDGLVLNALKLPGGNIVHTNPLLDSGFDLEIIAYSKTNGLIGFAIRRPPYEEIYFKLFGLSHALSMFHIDITMTQIYIAGPGGKIWIRSRPKGNWKLDDLSRLDAFENWDPDRANLETHEYEVTELPAGGGIYLQQPGRRHAVIGTHADGPAATLTVGGYFLCAARIRSAMAVILHISMLSHLLSNAEHVALWQIYIRIAMFWLYTTSKRPQEHAALAGYLPDLSLSPPRGWMDIVYLACMITLLPCLDHRNYSSDTVPEFEVEEAAAVCEEYSEWRGWVSETYSCQDKSGNTLDWEADIFSACLLHMAIALSNYHTEATENNPTAEIFQHFTPVAFQSKLRAVLRSYDPSLDKLFASKKKKTNPENFFLFDGEELTWRKL